MNPFPMLTDEARQDVEDMGRRAELWTKVMREGRDSLTEAEAAFLAAQAAKEKA